MLVTWPKVCPAVMAILIGLAPVPAPAQEPVSALPGGASSLQETYQDWRLSCESAAPRAICTVSQRQTQQNGQRVLAIELVRNGKDILSGNLVLPFGLLLDAGASLQ